MAFGIFKTYFLIHRFFLINLRNYFHRFFFKKGQIFDLSKSCKSSILDSSSSKGFSYFLTMSLSNVWFLRALLCVSLGGKKSICPVCCSVEITERAIMWHLLDFKKWKKGEAFNCMGNLIRFRLIKFIFYINMFTNIIASR